MDCVQFVPSNPYDDLAIIVKIPNVMATATMTKPHIRDRA